MPKLISEKKLAANRANAAKSTGPKTETGKAKVAQNAAKHGFRARSLTLTPDEQPEFDLFRDDLLRETQPLGPLELEHFAHLLHASWCLRRIDSYESALLLPDPDNPNHNPFTHPANLQSLATLNRYRADLKRELTRSAREIERLQTKRASLNLSHPATAISVTGASPCADPLKLTKQTQTADRAFDSNDKNNLSSNVYDCPSISQRLLPTLEKLNSTQLSTNQTHAVLSLGHLNAASRDSTPPQSIRILFDPPVESNPTRMKK
jgi:hypothetical protein